MTGNRAQAVSIDVDPLSAELLQSVVDVARAFFGGEASSVFLLDEEAQELVFQTVSGRGQGSLVGRRFPANSGVAGWVVMSGEPIIINDLSHNSLFDVGLAESTQYVPESLMAAPLVHGERMLGVLEVLDPVPQSRSSLSELDLLAMFARQAGAALRVVIERQPRRTSMASMLDGDGRAAAANLMQSLRQLLDTSAP